MASELKSIFLVKEPGLVYSSRLALPVDNDTVDFKMDPNDPRTPFEGEWLYIDGGFLKRAADADGLDKLSFPVLLGVPRLDIQSAQGKLSVLIHKGALCATSMFAKYASSASGTNSVDYNSGDNLVLGLAKRPDDVSGATRVVLVPSGTEVAGSNVNTENGTYTVQAVGTVVVGKVVFPPRIETGFGVGDSMQLLTFITV
jgi:hypothetical protein